VGFCVINKKADPQMRRSRVAEKSAFLQKGQTVGVFSRLALAQPLVQFDDILRREDACSLL
jgi:hypothetical protein